MPRRLRAHPGDWASIATRLDEIISAHTGEDPFEEALKLLVARLWAERRGQQFTAAGVDAALAEADAAWPGVLAEARCRLDGAERGRCVALLAELSLLAEELVGLDAVFEYIVTRTAKGQKGQYFTPRHVVAELARMVRLRPGEVVIDPACGSGAFLRHALREEPACEVYGFDQDDRAVRVARVMLAASGRLGRIQRLDSLVPGALEAWVPAADVILTNPPFAGDVGVVGSALARKGRAERDVLFLERCVGLLRPGGRLAIVLPNDTLGAARLAHVRAWLLAEARVVAVVGLGRNSFQPHTSQKAAVLLAEKRRGPPTAEESVLFFAPERDAKDSRGRLRLVDGRPDHDLHLATAAVREAWC